MHQQISKKFFIYLFVFLMLVTVNNTKLSQFNFPKIDNLEIVGLDETESKKLYENIKSIKKKNIFSLNEIKISNIVYSNKTIQGFTIFKKYPSKLKIEIEKAKLLAITKKDNLNFFIGSNGNLIQVNNSQINLPFVFGDINLVEFFKFKKIIDDSNLSFNEIKNLYYFKSKRWDIETKDGLIIKLPLKGINTSLHLLSKISNKEEFKNIKLIDFRQNNQVIINE